MDGAAARLNGDDLPAQRKTVLPGDILTIGQIDLELDRHVAEADDPMFVWSDSALGDDDAPRAAPPAAPLRTGRRAGAIAAVVVALAAAGALAAWRGGADGAPHEATAPTPGQIQALLAAYPEVEVVAVGEHRHVQPHALGDHRDRVVGLELRARAVQRDPRPWDVRDHDVERWADARGRGADLHRDA